MSLFSRRFLFEADEDNTGTDPNLADPPADTAGDDPNTADNNTEDTTGDGANNETENNNDNTEDQNQEDNTEDNQDNGDNEEDFTIDDADTGDGEDTGEEGETDPNADTEENTDGGDENNDDQPEVDPDSLKAKDAELFDSLSPEEQKMKIKVQKKMFLELYTNADIIIKKINEIGSELEEVNSQLKRTLQILFELKNMIYEYLMNTFDTKSYIENDIMYTRYLSVFNSVKNITTEIRKACVDETEEDNNQH